eukprot:TRINITY_DN11354_c0_g1_i1.p2 TRINITY_DN11354_c0_g1~~TRINITY_DN11354_c0_g1_i1.p2  ORF type:complete len:237 (+),score=57.96 TRINITY_DN11354_c0_g1_i1:31-711(+)
MQSASDKEPSNTMLYVSNLPFSFEDKDLAAIFADFQVDSAYVAVRHNGRSKGFGFVTFKSPEQQKAALAYDGKDLDGRPLTVKVAHKDDRRDAKGELKEEFKTADSRQSRGRGGGQAERTLSETVVYVSNLPFEFSDEDLMGVFAQHKPVSARIARRGNARSKGFGFVEFGSTEAQQAALALDGHTIDEREITVKVSMSGVERPEKPAGEKKKKQQQQKLTKTRKR